MTAPPPPPAGVIEAALAAVARMEKGRISALIRRHGAMRIAHSAPVGEQALDPAPEDRLYMVVRGSGSFRRGAERRGFGPGHAIFVEAGIPHRFEEFSEDLSVWIILWGAGARDG